MFESNLQSFVLNDDGSIAAPVIRTSQSCPDKELNPLTFEEELNIAQVHDDHCNGQRDYFTKMGFTKPFWEAGRN